MSHLRIRCVVLLATIGAFAHGPAQAATVLEYDTTGTCQTDFDRMAFDGLYARIDQSNDGSDMSTIFDDSEQLMHMLMHDTRNVMTMESDDDAIDFQSDVGRSTLLFAGNQTRELTGMDTNELMQQARNAQVSACPELAGMGFADPDYADAAARCAETMAAQWQQGGAGTNDAMLAALAGQGVTVGSAGGKRGVVRSPPAAAAPMPMHTTTTDRDGSEETINGLVCRTETLRRGDTVLRQQCVVELESLGLDAAPMRRIKRIVKVGSGISEGIASLHPDMDPDRDQPPVLALRRTCYTNGQQTGTATLRIERNVQVAAGDFEVPAGYTPFDMNLPDGEDLP